MNKVITINLNGRAYQLEEGGYEALRAYLDDASARLAEDPGKGEIIADLEQAIAEKCDKLLTPFKTVVTNDEIKKIIDEMGPVEGDAKTKSEDGKHEQHSGPRAPKRFFLIREDAVFAGVCAGLAAYFDVDVTLVRIGFIALTVFTGGIWILFYLAMALLVPYADTAEARAQAHGEPFNAEALVQRAKERWSETYERVTGEKWDENSDFADAFKIPADSLKSAHDQHLKWREMKRQQKQQWKHQWRAQQRQWNPAYGILRALLALVWILALISLIQTGGIFGWMIPAAVPLWASIILLFIAFHAVTGPLHNAGLRWGPNGEYYGSYDGGEGFVGGLTFIFLVIAFGWAYLHVPQVYFFVHHPVAGTKDVISYLGSLWQQR